MRNEVTIKRIVNGYILEYEDLTYQLQSRFFKDFIELFEFLKEYFE